MRSFRAVPALLLLLVLPAPVCSAQPDKKADQEPGDDVQAWLRYLDGRIYTPPRLEALSFVFRPLERKDPQAREGAPAPFLVRYRWRRGTGDRVDYLGHGLEELEQLPLALTDEQREEMRRDYLQIARGLAGMVKGMSLREQYGDWNGRVVRKVVNHQEEISLVLEPRQHPRLRRVVLSLDRHGLPWKAEKLYHSGDRFTQHHTYEQREEGWVLTKLQRLHTPVDPSQPPFDSAFLLSYQRVNGVLLPTAIEKMGKDLPAVAKGRTELQQLAIDEGVPLFEPQKDK